MEREDDSRPGGAKQTPALPAEPTLHPGAVNFDLAEIVEPNEVAAAEAETPHQVKAAVPLSPSKNPQDTPKNETAEPQRCIAQADLGKRKNAAEDADKKKTTELVTASHPTAGPSGPTQTATAARQYAEKIQRFGEKNVVRRAHKRNHALLKDGVRSQKDPT